MSGSSTWFSAFSGDDDDVTNFISASSLRRQARRHIISSAEEQTFSFREETRRVDLSRVSMGLGRDDLRTGSLLASRVSVGRDSRRIDFSSPGLPSFARDINFSTSPPSFRRGRRVEVEEVPSSPAPSSKADSAELADIRHSLKDLRDENQKLQAVVNDVMEVNKRWQRHHSDRELYVQKLLNTISELQMKASSRATDNVTLVKESSRLAGVSASTERLAQLEAENAQLRLDVESSRRKVQALEQEHKEHAELLEIQVRSYKDDWEAERREKEQAVRDKQAAEERSRDLVQQVAQLQRKLQEREKMNIPVSAAPQVTHRCCPHSHICESSSAPVVSSAHCCGNSGRSTTFRTSVHLPSLSQVQLREPRLPENIALDGVSRVSSSVDSRLSSTLDSRPDSPLISDTSINAAPAPITIGFEDGLASVQTFSFPPSEISSKKMSVLQIAAPPVSTDVFKEWQKQPLEEEGDGILTQTRENISCPRCGKIFPPEKHIKFLDHFDECQEQKFNSNFCDVK